MKLEEKRDYVQRFFSATGETYDHIVRRCTFGIDGLWKKSILNELDNPVNLLDLACGTGILTFAIAKRFPGCRIVGVDISESYLNVARRKAERFHSRNVQFVRQWAEEFISDERFDCITSSYLAKYADLSHLVRNAAAMLNPGGLLLFHDFTYPQSRLIASAWELYFILLQNIGALRYPQWRNVFHELPDLIRKTRWVLELTSSMQNNNLSEIRINSLTLEGATLITGRKLGDHRHAAHPV